MFLEHRVLLHRKSQNLWELLQHPLVAVPQGLQAEGKRIKLIRKWVTESYIMWKQILFEMKNALQTYMDPIHTCGESITIAAWWVQKFEWNTMHELNVLISNQLSSLDDCLLELKR